MPYEIRQTETFTKWIRSVRDRMALMRINARIKAISVNGHFGDFKSVGGGVSELRIHVGKSYRVYYTLRGNEIVILLAGSDKSDQARAIKLAKQLAVEESDA